MSITTNNIHIYFGNAADRIWPDDYMKIRSCENFYAIPAFALCKQRYNLEHLLFLRQVHGVEGAVFSHQKQAALCVPFSAQGDYLITHLPRVGIGVMTADCLPVVLWDEKHKALAVVHVGWRGAVDGIMKVVLQKMHAAYNTSFEDVHAWFGPSARACCYQVGSDVVDLVSKYSYAATVVVERESKIFFDLGTFVWYQLQELDVPASRIITSYNVCTICDHDFCSYRRQGKQAGRQMTVAWIL
jgi:YfiH family protein